MIELLAVVAIGSAFGLVYAVTLKIWSWANDKTK